MKKILGLQWVGVLKLVDEDVREPLLQVRPHRSVIAQEITRSDEEVDEVQLADAPLEILVAFDGMPELPLQTGS